MIIYASDDRDQVIGVRLRSYCVEKCLIIESPDIDFGEFMDFMIWVTGVKALPHDLRRDGENTMYGAILGDIIGSPFEFQKVSIPKDFPLFSRRSTYTDDTVMTIAVCEALLDAGQDADTQHIKKLLIPSMHKWGGKYPNAGYGGTFIRWLLNRATEPYGSYGNGSAMRVSAAGWLYDSLERTREVAAATAEVTHNHPEGIKGAEAIASAIYLARTGSSKEDIKEYIVDNFHYNLNRTCDEIREEGQHDVSCQVTVPEAITAFLEGEDFEDVVRTAVSLGGDTDTIAAMAGSIAEAFYGVPEELKSECRKRLPEDLLQVLDRYLSEIRV